jgi:hypothetical protein
LVRVCVRLATERVLHDAWEHEQAAALGRDRDARRELGGGERHGSEAGTVQTAEGVRRLPRPPGRGLREPSRSPWGAALGRTREVLATLRVERSAGGRSQRDMETAREQACGPLGRSQSASRASTASVAHA